MLVQAFISCRFYCCNSLFYGISDELMTWLQSVQTPECCCTSRDARSTVWPHHASTTSAALASGLEASGLQDSHLGLPFVVRHGSGFPGRWLSAVVWRRSSSAVFCRLEDVLSGEPAATLGSDVSRLPDLWNSLSTGLRQTDIGYESYTNSLNGNGCWWLICFGHWYRGALCDYLFKLRLPKFSYLFTYLIATRYCHSENGATINPARGVLTHPKSTFPDVYISDAKGQCSWKCHKIFAREWTRLVNAHPAGERSFPNI